MLRHIKHHSSFFLLAVSVGIFTILNTVFVQYSNFLSHIGHGMEVIQPLFFVGGLFLLGTICYSLSRGTIFPSFLVALFIGLSMHDLLRPLVENSSILNLLVTIAAVYILFGGGLEISFTSFKKIVLPTLLLSIIGLALSTFLFAGSLSLVSSTFGFGMSVSIALLLGAILGGGNAAFESAAQLAAYCKTVTIINRSETFRADPVTVEKVCAKENVKVIKGVKVDEIIGEKFVKGLIYSKATTANANSGSADATNIEASNKEPQTLAVGGIFVEIGLLPNTTFVKDIVSLDSHGKIQIDPRTQRTQTAGIWAAGDCTDGLYHQNNIAAGDAVKALEDIYVAVSKR